MWIISDCRYEEDESKVWYYSTIPQFEDVLDLMDPEDLEKELCEALGELRSEIDNHMDVTQKLTKKYSSGKTVYLDQANGKCRWKVYRFCRLMVLS